MIAIDILYIFEKFNISQRKYLGFEFMLGSVKRGIIIAEICHAHQKHCHNALHRRWHRICYRIVNAFRSIRIVKRQKYDIIRCKNN